MIRFVSLLGMAAFLAISSVGCSKGYAVVPVKGTVKFSDGSIPQGEIRIVRFEPVTSGPTAKAAAGDIGADGSYQLTTVEPNDGAFPGEYKVTFSIFKTYLGQEQLVAPQFITASTTPFTVKVPGGKYDFTIEKAP